MSASTSRNDLPDRTKTQPSPQLSKNASHKKEESSEEEGEEESEDTEPTTWPTISLSFPLPYTPRTLRAHVKVTRQSHCQLVFLASSSSESDGAPSLGSFVYAIPNRKDASALPASTPLYSNVDTLDFATVLAKGLAKRARIPTYVSCSLSLSSVGVSGNVAEQMEATQKIMSVIETACKACAKQLE